MLTIGSLFSGIGGLELGLEWAGLGPTIWQVEQSAECRAVLAAHWPSAERFTDVCAVGRTDLAPVDLLCGGFPCQDVSSAGARVGLAGARSGLWREFARLVGELAPAWVVVENVASGAGRWLDAVVRDLGEHGYASLPLPLSSALVGAPHRRERIFVVARRLPDSGREHLRQLAERRHQQHAAERGNAEPRNVGARAVADSGGVGCEHGDHSATSGDGRCHSAGMADAESHRRGAWKPQQSRIEGRHGSRLDRDALAHAMRSRSQASIGHLRARQSDADGRGEVVAYASGLGCEQQPPTRLHGRGQPGYDAARPSLGFPPGPNDRDGWAAWTLAGGPEPVVRRGATGLPFRLDAATRRGRLRALGNSVQPQCAEVVGWVIRELIEAQTAPPAGGMAGG